MNLIIRCRWIKIEKVFYISTHFVLRSDNYPANVAFFKIDQRSSFFSKLIEAWAGLTGNRPEPYEVEALIMLDAAMMSRGDEPESAEDAEPVVTPAWPTKKTGAV